MRVSVVMPTFDQEAFLPAAVDSLLSQSLTDWELVVVDDGSPGDVKAALGEALDDPRVRLEQLPVNGGLGAALNRGLDLTTADLVAYLPQNAADITTDGTPFSRSGLEGGMRVVVKPLLLHLGATVTVTIEFIIPSDQPVRLIPSARAWPIPYTVKGKRPVTDLLPVELPL